MLRDVRFPGFEAVAGTGTCITNNVRQVEVLKSWREEERVVRRVYE